MDFKYPIIYVCLLNNRDFLTKTNFRGYKIIVSRVEITKQASATQPCLAFKVHHLGFPYVPIIKMCAMLLLLLTAQWRTFIHFRKIILTVGIIQLTEEFEFPAKTVFENILMIIDLR